MSFNQLNFGRHKGKTLPQVLFENPSWFFWAIREGAFNGRGALELEAEELNIKARTIRIPQNGSGALELEAEELNIKARSNRIPQNESNNLIAKYVIVSFERKVDRIDIIPASMSVHDSFAKTIRSKIIDLSIPYQLKHKNGDQFLISDIKKYLFGDENIKMTKSKCEDFFNNDDNFDLSMSIFVLCIQIIMN